MVGKQRPTSGEKQVARENLKKAREAKKAKDAKAHQDQNPHPLEHKPYNSKQMKEMRGKIEDRTMTQEEYRRYGSSKRLDKRRDKGVRRFYKQERKAIEKGKPTKYQWNDDQKNRILQNKKPQKEGATIQGHHERSVNKYPHQANNPDNIKPVTPEEHLHREHGGNFRNQTDGEPLNPQYKGGKK